MTTAPSMPTTDETLYCANHPKRETMVRCGKCEKPLCTECMYMTPVGVRCRECANLKPIPTYHVPPLVMLRAAVVAIPIALALAYVLRATPAAAFGFFLAPLYGWLVAEAVARVSNQKRGVRLQLVATVAIAVGLLAWPAIAVMAASGRLALDPRTSGQLVGQLANMGFLFQLGLALIFGITRLR